MHAVQDLVIPPMTSAAKYSQSPLVGGPPKKHSIFAFFKASLGQAIAPVGRWFVAGPVQCLLHCSQSRTQPPAQPQPSNAPFLPMLPPVCASIYVLCRVGRSRTTPLTRGESARHWRIYAVSVLASLLPPRG